MTHEARQFAKVDDGLQSDGALDRLFQRPKTLVSHAWDRFESNNVAEFPCEPSGSVVTEHVFFPCAAVRDGRIVGVWPIQRLGRKTFDEPPDGNERAERRLAFISEVDPVAFEFVGESPFGTLPPARRMDRDKLPGVRLREPP
jgi:hypothetical protein